MTTLPMAGELSQDVGATLGKVLSRYFGSISWRSRVTGVLTPDGMIEHYWMISSESLDDPGLVAIFNEFAGVC